MFVSESLPFVTTYLDKLDTTLKSLHPQAGLSERQKRWLRFCVVAIVVTNSLCWKRFERASLGRRSHAALSWMFRQSKVGWQWVLWASVLVILRVYGIQEGVLVVDDSEKRRSKVTKRIYKAHQLKDKTSGGRINGQSLVVLVLVTPLITIPTDVVFYMPDPVLSGWKKHDKALRRQGILKSERPTKPPSTRDYPTKQVVALGLLEAFHRHFPQITVRCVLADALYGTEAFLDQASAVFGGIQVISQVRQNQKLRFKTQEMPVAMYFSKFPGFPETISIRGGKTERVSVGSARLAVCAHHHKKRFVIALKYEGEEDYRYLVAVDLSWRTLDIVQAYTFRWLVEVFFQDWKSYEGWGQLTKQPDEEGSRCSLILSLLCDHCLLLHPDQLARLEHNLPAWTVGSLCEAIKLESLMQCLWEVVSSEEPHAQFQRMAERIKDSFPLASSAKHMAGRELGRLEPTPALEYRARVVMKAA